MSTFNLRVGCRVGDEDHVAFGVDGYHVCACGTGDQ